MKQLLFLLLFPCFALAQYSGNAGQKITLGEQTTADGLVYRGVAADTTLTVKSDTAAYFVLDTVNLNLYTYKASASGRKWRQLGADTAAIAYVNTYGTQTVNGAKTFTSELTATRFNPTANTETGTGMFLPAANTLGFSTNGTEKVRITSGGELLINTKTYQGAYVLQANGNVLVGTDLGATAAISELRVGNTGANSAVRVGQGATNNGFMTWFYNATAASAYLALGTYGGNNKLALQPDGGNVGIGTVSPAVQFHTTGDVRFAGLASITDLRTDADGDLFNGSDFNLKNSIDTINFGLSDVLKLKPVSFNWNDEQRNINEYKSMGFIAQDVMDVIPNAASTMGDGDMQVDYNAIVATLTKAIQEQQALIKALEQRIINLENK